MLIIFNCFNLHIYSFDTELSLSYTLEAEKFTGKVLSRVWFKGADRSAAEIEHSVAVRPQDDGGRTCVEHMVYIIVSGCIENDHMDGD